jgi:hypothetical protein
MDLLSAWVTSAIFTMPQRVTIGNILYVFVFKKMTTKLQLESVRNLLRANSMSEVARLALAGYDFFWNEKVAGATVVIRVTNRSEQKLLFVQ